MKIGVLALQGSFAEHKSILQSLGADAVEVRLPAQLRGLDGLMRNTDPQRPLAQAAGPVMATGALEQSNVDAAGALVQMIQLQRQFEMQVKVISRGDDNAQAANSLLRLGG